MVDISIVNGIPITLWQTFTYLWKIIIFHGKIHYFDWAIFNSYVKLPEGTYHYKLLSHFCWGWRYFANEIGNYNFAVTKKIILAFNFSIYLGVTISVVGVYYLFLEFSWDSKSIYNLLCFLRGNNYLYWFLSILRYSYYQKKSQFDCIF